jgi:uncharacterized protein (DUF2252 family)
MTIPLNLKQRMTFGQTQRKHLRRTDQANWNQKSRAESFLKVLKASTSGRVQSLIALKNQRMAVSPFMYFRGAVSVMAYDLSLSPNSGIYTQLCGDAHVRNLGAFEGPEGRLLFDINDFDETIAGPFEWDVKRMATSIILAGWDTGAKSALCQQATEVFLESYRRSILRFARMPVLELARYQVHRLDDLATMSQIFAIAQRSTPAGNLATLTEPTPRKAVTHRKTAKKSKSGKSATLSVVKTGDDAPSLPRIFKQNAPLLTRMTGTAAQRILDSLTTYANSLLPERRHFLAQYRPVDVAFKVVGTGSIGLRDYCVYMEGSGPNDPLFLQIKEEAPSAYAPYLGKTSSALNHQGKRVVEGERAMQLQSDLFLGWTTIDNRDFLVRQLNDHKASIDPSQLKATGLLEYATVCGEILARGHSRSGDAAVLAGYLGQSARLDQAIAKFAVAYANQTELDWKRFVHSTNRRTKPKSPHQPHKVH